MENNINPIMARFDNEPALTREGRSSWLQACAQAVSAHTPELAKIEASDEFWFSSDDWRSHYRPYKVKDGILTIPVKGLLLNNFPFSYGSFATGYEYIWEAMKRGIADREVKGIVLSVDSGGGMVNGNFDLVDRMYAVRGTKPIRAFTTDGAYSAAYSIASAADRIIVGRTAGVGSIGVVTIHADMSRQLEERGITVNIVRSKPRKMEGNAYEPLTDAAREAMQSRIDAMHNQFVAIVARNRDMEESAVDGTDALCFMPEDAIERGLADEVGNADDAFTAFVAYLNSDTENEPMGQENKATITEEAHAAAIAAATATARTEGASTERARISAIMGSDVAKDRPVASQMFAFDMDMSADDAMAKLAKLPVEAKAEAKPTEAQGNGAGAGAATFTAAMGSTQNPNITGDAGQGDEGEGTQSSRVQATLGLAFGDRKTA